MKSNSGGPQVPSKKIFPVHWTDERIKALLEAIDKKGTPSPAHTSFAALMLVRDWYEDYLRGEERPLDSYP
jgi:hypothetical protein